MNLRLLTLKLFLIVGAFTSLFAQDTYWNFVVDNAPFTHLSQILPTSDNGLIVASTKTTHECPSSNIISKIDSTGNIIWHLPLSGDSLGVITVRSLLELPNGDIVIAGGTTGVGDLYVDIPIAFHIIDSDGIPKIKTTVYSNFAAQMVIFPTSTAILNDEQILMSIYDSLFVVDTSGMVLDSLDFSTLDSIQTIHVLEEDQWLLQARNQLYMSDDSTNILANFSTENDILNCDLLDDYIYILTSKRLLILDKNLAIVQTKNLENHELYPSLFIAPNEEIWLQLYDENIEQIMVGMLDENLNFIEPFSISPDLFEVEKTDLTVGNNQFYLTSERYGHLSISGFDKEEFDYTPPYEDIEIIDIVIDSLKVMDWNESHYYQAYTQVRIQNNGTDTLRQFFLFLDSNWGGWCISADEYRSYTDLAIAPNEIIQISFSFSNAIYNGNFPEEVEFCLSCKTPNQHIETVIDNNYFCQTTTAYLSTPKVSFSNIHLYPNPCQEEIFIETSSSIKSLSIFELSGSQVWESTSFPPSSTVDIGHLTNGVYLVKIVAEDQVYLEKIVKN